MTEQTVQACERQEASVEAAKALMEGFEAFFRIQQHVKELQERAQTQEAVLGILELVKRACEYVRDKTKHEYYGKDYYKFPNQRVCWLIL